MPKSLFISFILVCFLAACKKQNDNNPPQPSIVGKWNYQKTDMAFYINNKQQPPVTLLPVTSSIVFNNDSTFTETYSSSAVNDTTKGNFSLSGGNLSFSNSTSKGNGPTGTIVPSPLPLFFPEIYSSATLTVSIKIKQITTSILTLHTEIVAISAPDTVKEVLDEYYTK